MVANELNDNATHTNIQNKTKNSLLIYSLQRDGKGEGRNWLYILL